MNRYLFVYPSLPLGGVETFFVRLAKQFEKRNKKLIFLFLFKEGSNAELMSELSMHADICYWEDLCYFGSARFLGPRAKFFMPLKKDSVESLLSECYTVHVSCALTYFSAQRIFAVLQSRVKIVFGIYHSNELAWGKAHKPWYETYFRKFIFGKNNIMLLFFNDVSKAVTLESNGVQDVVSSTFPLGVDFPASPREPMPKSPKTLRIVSVGRLTEFKTYNVYMLEVVRELVNKGLDIKYDIYGSGPLYEYMLSEVNRLGLVRDIVLQGDLRYSHLDDTLRKYDVFVGTGTALLHAAANGVPCITAIENEQAANTYGFFSDLQGTDYHEQNSAYEKMHIEDVLITFDSLEDHDRAHLENMHVYKSRSFGMEACTNNFSSAFEEAPIYRCSTSPFYIYMTLFFMAEFIPRLLGKSTFRKKYDHVL